MATGPDDVQDSPASAEPSSLLQASIRRALCDELTARASWAIGKNLRKVRRQLAQATVNQVRTFDEMHNRIDKLKSLLVDVSRGERCER
ncbi:hypothetical protein MTO96_014469 [Rhipicephalus appendiculatus]